MGPVNGSLTALFGNPQGRAIAKVLDQSVLVGNMEQSIRMLADATELDYKTVQKSLQRLELWGFVKRGRKIGITQTYRFNVENDLHDLVNFARKMQLAPRRGHRSLSILRTEGRNSQSTSGPLCLDSS